MPNIFRIFASVKTNDMAKKILFINQEITPYVPETQLSSMGLMLSQSMQEKGHEIRTFMPKWGNINERRGQLHEVIRLSGMNLIINETDHPLIIKVASIQASRLQVYFIDNDDYFTKRLMGTDENGDDYADNGERAIFFARGVLETVKKLRWIPDVIHCQGWMSSIIPLYIKKAYNDEPSFANTKVITSLFPDSPKETWGADFKKILEYKGIDAELLKDYSQDFTPTDVTKLAIDYSDGIILASNDTPQDTIDYAKTKSVPFLDYQEGDFTAAYEKFYGIICGESQE